LKADHKLKKIQNTNYALEVAKNAGLKMIGIGGVDIVDSKKKLILAMIF